MAKWSRKKKTIYALLFLTAVIILVFFGAQLGLYLNFLVGNDILIRLSASREYISIMNGEKTNVTFKIDTLNNVFCEAKCMLEFEDLTRNSSAKQNISLRSGSKIQRTFEIIAPLTGTGSEVYRFSVSCSNEKKVFCPADDSRTSRKVLVVVEHDLTPVERLLQKDLKEKILGFQETLANQSSAEGAIKSAYDKIEQSKESSDAERNWFFLVTSLKENENALAALIQLWKQGDYYAASNKAELVMSSFSATNVKLATAKQSVESLANRHNEIIRKFNEAKEKVSKLTAVKTTDSLIMNEAENAIRHFNESTNSANQEIKLEARENLAETALTNTLLSSSKINYSLRIEAVKKEVKTDLKFELVCNVSGNCQTHPSPYNRSHQTEVDMNLTCERLNVLNSIIKQITANYTNITLNESSKLVADKELATIEYALKERYALQIDPDGVNGPELLEMLGSKNNLTNISSLVNKTLLLAELSKIPLDSCATLPAKQIALVDFSAAEIIIAPQTPQQIFQPLIDPKPQCCLFGSCTACCEGESCRNSPSKYPIIFLHGHLVNNQLSVDYSLEAFNYFQLALEKEGWLDAGAISLYTSGEVPYGAWGRFPNPLTIKGSYYYDVFLDQGNYVYQPTKSENIDTYSIRLKELIDKVQFRTGSPKVILAGHSMGGLVARRYLQIFGNEKVDRLIVIGTPNKGIEGNVAAFCPVIGAKRECEDMSEDSIFLKKLNSGEPSKIPLFNIIGTGCNMNGEQGDGIVLERSAQLDGAFNFVFNGTCSSQYDNLHNHMLFPEEYPEVYEFFKKALTANST
ncbi:MAG: alpha/beta fold hydrolase [Nanoarchaeota archaeon]